MQLVEILGHNVSQERRVVFSLPSADCFLVVKFFDDQQAERHTFKVFRGMYEKVRAFWATTVSPISPTSEEGRHLEEVARRTVSFLLQQLK